MTRVWKGAAGLAIAVVAGAATPAASVDLTLSIQHLRSHRGAVMICVTERTSAFPDCKGDSKARRLIVDADKAGSIVVSGLAPGDYAVAVIHDENRNGRLDKRLVIPREGFGFSRNPPIGFGPPAFAAARFSLVSGPVNQTIRMRYIF